MQSFLRRRLARVTWVKWAHLGDMCLGKKGRASAQSCGRRMQAVVVAMVKLVTVANVTTCVSVACSTKNRGCRHAVRARASLLILVRTVTQGVPTPFFAALRQHRPARRDGVALLHQRCNSLSVIVPVRPMAAPSSADWVDEMSARQPSYLIHREVRLAEGERMSVVARQRTRAPLGQARAGELEQRPKHR